MDVSCEPTALPNQSSARGASGEQAALLIQNSAGNASIGEAALSIRYCAGDASFVQAALPSQNCDGGASFGQATLPNHDSTADTSCEKAAMPKRNCVIDASFETAAMLNQNCDGDASYEKAAVPNENLKDQNCSEDASSCGQPALPNQTCAGDPSCAQPTLPDQNCSGDASCEQPILPNQNCAGDASCVQAALPAQSCARNDSFAFWRHIPPPSLWFRPGPHSYYGGLPWPPYNPYQQYWSGAYYGWNGSYYGFPAQYTPQATTHFQVHSVVMEEKPSNQEPTSPVVRSHCDTPMDISPCDSPVYADRDYTSTSTKAEAVARKDTNYYQGTSKSLEPHEEHKADPRLASLSALPLLKRCEPCVRKVLAQATGDGSANLREHCSCVVGLTSDNVSRDSSYGSRTAKTEEERTHQRPTVITESTRLQTCSPVSGMFQKTSEHELRGPAQYTMHSAVPISNFVQVAGRVTSPPSTFVKKRRTRTLVKIDCLAEGDVLSSGKDCGQNRGPVLDIADSSKGAQAEKPSFVSRRQNFAEHTFDGAEKGATYTFGGRGHPDNGNSQGCKLLGVYTPRPETEILTTNAVHFEEGPTLGSRVEFLDEPLKLTSELEKLDEGWQWCFE